MASTPESPSPSKATTAAAVDDGPDDATAAVTRDPPALRLPSPSKATTAAAVDDGQDDATAVTRDPPALRLSVSTMEGYEMAREAMRGIDLDESLEVVWSGGKNHSPALEEAAEKDAIAALAEDSDEEDVLRRSAAKAGTTLDNATVSNMNDLAKEHMKRGQYDKAIFLLEEILKAKRAENGESHRDVGAALHNLAMAHIKAQDYGRALPLCQEAVRVRREALGGEDLDTASSLVKLGTVLCSLGKREDALGAHREALRIRRVLLGERDQSVGQVLGYVGVVYFEEGESLAALSAFDDALRIQRLSATGNHERGETLSNIGTVRMKRQQFDEAIVAFEEAYSVQQLEYKDGHPALIYTLDCLAFSHAKDGNNRDAVKAYKKMLRSQIATYGPTHLDCALTLNKISAIHEKGRKYSAAYECTRQALSIQQKRLPGNHPALAQTQKNRARLEKRMRNEHLKRKSSRSEC